jgi:transcriptional regulator with XRE-family HTH domain
MRTNAAGLRMNKLGDFLSQETRQRRVGQLLARARKKSGLRQDEVSAYLRLGGRERVSKLENGQQPVAWLELEALAALYGCPTSEFASWSEETAQLLRNEKDDVDRRARMPPNRLPKPR